MCRRTKALQLTAEITAANQTLQAFKLKDLERQRDAEHAMEGERLGRRGDGGRAEVSP